MLLQLYFDLVEGDVIFVGGQFNCARMLIMKVNTIYNNVSSVFIAHILCFFVFNSFGQLNKINFEISDSTIIQFPISNKNYSEGNSIKLYNNSLYFLSHASDTLFLYSLIDKSYSSVVFNIENEIKKGFVSYTFFVCKDGYCLVDMKGKTALHLSKNGDLLHKIKFKPNSKFYIPDAPLFEYDSELEQFFISTKIKTNRDDFKNNKKRLAKYYSREGLISCFDNTGKQINAIGRYDSIYLNNLYQYQDQYYMNHSNGLLLLSQQLSSKILIYNSKSKSLVQIDYPAAFVNNSQYYSSNYDMSTELLNQIELESLQFGNVGYLGFQNLFSRVYYLPIQDSSIKYKSSTDAYQRPPPNTCRVKSQRELIQDEMFKKKPFCLQIFDVNGQLLFDNYFPFKGTFILNNNSSDESSIFTCTRRNNSIIVYKYKIKSSY